MVCHLSHRQSTLVGVVAVPGDTIQFSQLLNADLDRAAAPTAEDLLMVIHANQARSLTHRLEGPDLETQPDDLVTLAALTTHVPRLVNILLAQGAPSFDVRLRWKRWLPAFSDSQATPYVDVIASVTMFTRYLDEHERADRAA